MSEVQAGKAKSGFDVGLILLAELALTVVAVLYVAAIGFKPGGAGLDGLAKGGMAKLEIAHPAKAAPDAAFTDETGKRVTLADFKGQVVVLNLWATWCTPCRVEMPTLAKLAAAYEGKPVKVLAVSVDTDADAALAARDIDKLPPLKLYRDSGYKLAFGLTPPAAGMPTTVIFGKDGQERARLGGGADWSGKDARAVIDAVLAEKS